MSAATAADVDPSSAFFALTALEQPEPMDKSQPKVSKLKQQGAPPMQAETRNLPKAPIQRTHDIDQMTYSLDGRTLFQLKEIDNMNKEAVETL